VEMAQLLRQHFGDREVYVILAKVLGLKQLVQF